MYFLFQSSNYHIVCIYLLYLEQCVFLFQSSKQMRLRFVSAGPTRTLSLWPWHVFQILTPHTPHPTPHTDYVLAVASQRFYLLNQLKKMSLATPGLNSVLNQKNLSVWKKEYIDSTAQKKSNKITKFLINAFVWVSKPHFIKMHWSKI